MEQRDPLEGLVERLRSEVGELQGRQEPVGGELEAKQRSLGLAEATLDLVQHRQQEAAASQKEGQEGAGGLFDEMEHAVSQAAQASGRCTT
jgi:hypothetical protein